MPQKLFSKVDLQTKAEHKILEKGRPGSSLSAISNEKGPLSLQNSETCMMN